MKDKESKKMRKFPFHTPKSDPTSPAGTTHVDAPPPLDFTRLQSGTSQIQKLYKTATPPLTPTTLSVDTAENKTHKINRSGSSGSEKKISGISARSVDDSVLHSGSGGGVVSIHPGGPSMSFSHTPTPKTSGAFQPPKSKFKMAHESFRIRMFQEQFGFEPVFMTKKRTADSKFSEFKGGDLNKYTSRSYTIKNGNEIFGVRSVELSVHSSALMEMWHFDLQTVLSSIAMLSSSIAVNFLACPRSFLDKGQL